MQEINRPVSSETGGKQRVLVTGAYGFLGRYVARHFAARGYQIHGIGHGDWGPEEWSQWGLSSWQSGDVTVDALRMAEVPDVIVHCAGTGSVGFAIAHPLEALDRTVSSTARVLEYIRLYAPECVLVYPSSASVYGNAVQVPIAEESPSLPISVYGVHKTMVEDLLVTYSREFGVRTAILRFFSLYGPGLRKQLLWDACGKLHAGNSVFMGTGNEVRDWLHVEDAANLIRMAADHASVSCPIVNGASGQGVMVRDILQALSDVCGHGAALSFTGEQREGDPQRYVADVCKAEAWGWKPASDWQSGVRAYAEWWMRSAQR